MSLNDTARRIRGFLEAASREAADEEGERRVYTYRVADLDGIYYDDVNGFPGRCVGGASPTPVAAQLSFVQLFNPAGSGIDVVVEQAILTSNTADWVDLRANTAGLGSVVTSVNRRDYRSNSTEIAQVRAGAEAAASGVQHSLLRLAAGVPLIVPLDFCLGPQNGLHFESQTVNLTLTVALWWREFVPSRRDRA